MIIKAKNITKSYDKKTVVLNDLSIDLEDGKLTTLLGYSGCGKTTLLKIIAGLETPDSGEIFFDDKLVFSKEKKINLLPVERGIGFVFQDFALWPNMTVIDNVIFAIKNTKKSTESNIVNRIKNYFVNHKENNQIIKNRAMECLKMVKIDNLATRHIDELSGGQKQRVAIARAIAINPSVMLFDEPLSALDAKLREEMRIEILNIVKKLNVTCVFVTHDQDEAMSISDRIIVMNKGRIIENQTPSEIYWHPKTKFVASFIGKSSFLNETEFLRPEDISLEKSNDSTSINTVLTSIENKGGRYSLEASDGQNNFYFYSNKSYEIGDKITIYYKKENIRNVMKV